jgi:hypothetical protein
MPENTRKLVKIQFHDPDVGYENLWAAPIKEKHFRIESIPFFVYGVSLGDIVTAMPDNEGRLQFGEVVKPSGHKTLRARSGDLLKNEVHRNEVIAHLRKLGSDVEALRSRLLAIDVPPNVSLEAVTDFLTNEAKVSWEYGNPENINK